MRNIIDHYQKLLPCEQFIITGSFGWVQLDLMRSAKDLDIVLVNPTDEALAVLSRLREPQKNKDYPEDKNHYVVKHDGVIIDFFVSKKIQEVIALANGLLISSIRDTVRAKMQYRRFKDFMQLKNVAEIFYKQSDFLNFIQDQQAKFSGRVDAVKQAPKKMCRVCEDEDE